MEPFSWVRTTASSTPYADSPTINRQRVRRKETMNMLQDDPPARVVTGRIKVHPDGYAFVVPEDHTEDIHVSARARGPAMDADRVEVEWWVGARGLEGKVRKVIERGRGKITGQIEG